MADYRIRQHPILSTPDVPLVELFWQGKKIQGQLGETIASTLYANGIHIFGYHPRDHSPQGIFCANGQCSQCMVLADGRPVKSCMELVQPGLRVEPADGLPLLPPVSRVPAMKPPREVEVEVMIIGGGPAGLSAAIELGQRGIQTVLVDDKQALGGKLLLQTHRFFGSSQAVYAGTRGIDIARRLGDSLQKYASVDIWVASTVLAVFEDRKVGVLRNGEYVLVHPQVLLVAAGAREKFLAFKGNTLPGVLGAGAFQTLVNRDLIRPSERLFIVGGGNVGLIAGYHALQAGIEVVGLVEALPECGGYKVHKDKLVRMGVPIFTSHTILSANGKDGVESVTIAQVDDQYHAISGTECSFKCDSVLVAVGLDSVREFYDKSQQYRLPAYIAGDAEEIAEASAAIFSGKIRGMEIARALGRETKLVPELWQRTGEILKSKPGEVFAEEPVEHTDGVMPIFHCNQEIPCNPCSTLCSHGLIHIDENDIRKTPTFLGNSYCCEVCECCVAGCPGLAITLVDYQNNPSMPVVSIPYEFNQQNIARKDQVVVMDTEGAELGLAEVVSVHQIPASDRTWIVQVQAPAHIATRIAGLRVQEPQASTPMAEYVTHIADDTIICRCERVTAGELRGLIRQGYRDLNEIKTISRAGMGACGSKTCGSMLLRLFREEGVPLKEVTEGTRRPLFVEVALGAFAGVDPVEGSNAK